MPRKAFRIIAEITIDDVTSPGSMLLNRDDLYLTIELFGEVKRTRLTDPIFPLIFHERFVFEKVFWNAIDPQEVTDLLEDSSAVLELRQVTDVYLGGTLLAYYDCNARDFLYPLPSYSPSMTRDREILMTRTVDFQGSLPKIHFSTYTIIRESTTPYLDSIEDAHLADSYIPKRPISPLLRSRARSPILESNSNYRRQTLSSTLRSRSPSPGLRTLCDELAMTDLDSNSKKQCQSEVIVNDRPPFVVRKLTDEIGRKPQLHDNFSKMIKSRKSTSPHGKRRKGKRPNSVSSGRYKAHWITEPKNPTRISCDACNLTHIGKMQRQTEPPLPPTSPGVKVLRESRDSTFKKSVQFGEDDEDDAEVEFLTNNTDAVATRRSVSPVLSRSPVSYRYSPMIDYQAERIKRRIDETLRRARSPSPLLRRYYDPYAHYYTSMDSLRDLEYDLARARRRY